jgi:hypothetical protein
MRVAIPRYELDRALPQPVRSRLRPAAEPDRRVRRPVPELVPDRYRIKRDARGDVLTCIEAPTLRVRVRRGFTVTATEARSYPPGSIFLDGAAKGEPFLDTERSVYNLDHHEGCVRPFTLSTCEQAMVLIRRGLDLRKRDWTIYANDADLDTLLAIWVLLNHLRLEDADTRAELMPLLRLQGAIDAQGLELQELCALPPDLLRETRARMDRIRERELILKARGRWNEVDLLAYTAERLRIVDGLIYAGKRFDGVTEVEELARTELTHDSIAVVCRSRAGIYEVEQQLRRLHGGRLGMIVLQKDPSTYSLRQVDPYLPVTLDRIYDRLNLIDPAAGGSRSPNRWGGSAEIGGSPRQTGTRATPEQIAAECRNACRRPTASQRLSRLGRAAWLSALLVLAAAASALVPSALSDAVPERLVLFAGVLTVLSGSAFLFCARRAPGLYGLRPPAGARWCVLLPVALFGALAGGVWTPSLTVGLAAPAPSAWPALATFLALPLTAELLFRGLIHGTLAASFPIQRAGGPWFLSGPVVLSSALYAVAGAGALAAGALQSHPWVAPGWAATLLGALLFGIAAGMARERAESIAAPLALHGICVAAALLVRQLL